MSKDQVAIVVGRFSPLHNGHCELIEKTCELWAETLIVIGSANLKERTEKTPFLLHERITFIYKVFPKLTYVKMDDVGNWKKWMSMLDSKIDFLYPNKDPVFIIGRKKDVLFYRASPYYQQRKRNIYEIGPKHKNISATKVRQRLLYGKSIKTLVRPKIHDDIINIWNKEINKTQEN